MVFPDKLTVIATMAPSGLPVEGVSFVIALKARWKNDYSVGPMVSDQDGLLEITREDCENAICRAQQMFIMDYAGDLSSCGPMAELRLQPPEQVANTIRQLESAPGFWSVAFDDPAGLVTALRKVRNASFEPTNVELNETDICQNPRVEVRLTELGPKPHRTSGPV